MDDDWGEPNADFRQKADNDKSEKPAALGNAKAETDKKKEEDAKTRRDMFFDENKELDDLPTIGEGNLGGDDKFN